MTKETNKECEKDINSSSMCDFGTKGCSIFHATPTLKERVEAVLNDSLLLPPKGIDLLTPDGDSRGHKERLIAAILAIVKGENTEVGSQQYDMGHAQATMEERQRIKKAVEGMKPHYRMDADEETGYHVARQGALKVIDS